MSDTTHAMESAHPNDRAQTTIDQWNAEQIYPFSSEPLSPIESAERKVFDVVARTLCRHLSGFAESTLTQKAFHLRMLRHAIESSPDELRRMLEEVLRLSPDECRAASDVLNDRSLPAIFGAARLVKERLQFLAALEAILFDTEPRRRLKERSQLHLIVAQNPWLFGDEFTLSVDDRSLTEVLRIHQKLLGEEVAIDAPAQPTAQSRGIIDLMLSKSARHHRANSLTHLVVALKAPRVKVDGSEIARFEKYAIAVMEDPRFLNVGTRWVFWLISDELGRYADHHALDPHGLIYRGCNVSIYAKTWAQVLDDNRARLQYLQNKLEIDVDKAMSIKYLQDLTSTLSSIAPA